MRKPDMTSNSTSAGNLSNPTSTLKYLPALTYIAGLATLMLIDIYVSKYATSHDVAAWAKIRSIIGIGASICLLGLDSVILRLPNSVRRIIYLIVLQVPILSVVMSITVWQLGMFEAPFEPFWMIISISIITTGYQFFRGIRQNFLAQLTFQSWKIVIFGTLVIYVISSLPLDIANVTIVALVSAAGGSILLMIAYRNHGVSQQDPHTVGYLYNFGFKYTVSTILLSIAIYAEQLVVAHFGTIEESANYFTHAIYFLFPISLISGYASFVLGPWIKDNPHEFAQYFATKKYKAVTVLGVVTLLSAAFGYTIWAIVNPTGNSPQISLQIIFSIVCLLRLAYSIPSSYLSFHGTTQQHDKYIIGQFLATAFVIAIFIFIYKFDYFTVPIAVGIATVLNWLFRNIAAYSSIWKSL